MEGFFFSPKKDVLRSWSTNQIKLLLWNNLFPSSSSKYAFMKQKYIPNKIRSSTVGQRSHILYTWQNWESECMKTGLQFYKEMKYCCVAFNSCCWMTYAALDGSSTSLVLFLEWPQVADNSRFVGNWSRQSWLSQCQPDAGAAGAKEEAVGSSKKFLLFKWTLCI